MWFSSALKLAAESMGFAAKRQELNNTPEMRAAARAAKKQAVLDSITKAVAERDLDAIRKILSNV